MSSRTYSSLCRVALQSAERQESPFRLKSVIRVQAVEDGIELSTPSETVQRDQAYQGQAYQRIGNDETPHVRAF